jgi:hypothetical protein
VTALFTRADGCYAFARWGRPIVPVVFGVDDAALSVIKGAIEVVVHMAGHKMAETDPELGANLMLFFLRDWAELPGVKGLAEMVPNLGPLCIRLAAENANQYRLFRFDAEGAIKAVFAFVRMDAAMAAMAAEDLALLQAVEALCTWGPQAFATRAPLGLLQGRAVLHPDIAGVIRAAYATTMPPVAHDASHALRLAARLG